MSINFFFINKRNDKTIINLHTQNKSVRVQTLVITSNSIIWTFLSELSIKHIRNY